jgi:hypothetical protein
MIPPKVSRPHFPKGYLENPTTLLAWDRVERRLVEAIHYWICSVRPDGRPHVVPRWGVWVDGMFFYDGSPETRHAKNIALNPHVSLHLESGAQALILNGKAAAHAKPDPDLARKLSKDYRRKYTELGYAPGVNQWDEGGLFSIRPVDVIAWTNFMDDPTRFVFTDESPG